MKFKHFVTVGHLNQGKSSLIGRLLWDTNKISLETKRYLTSIGGGKNLQFAYVLDHHKQEREEGITINVGHNKLLADDYSFTFSDAPGHKIFLDEALRGIEESNACIVVIAADTGVKEQTKRHFEYAQKIGIIHFVACITKMDKVGYSEGTFSRIKNQVKNVFKKIPEQNIIPTSALDGENILKKSQKMPWFEGKTFLESLESFPTKENSVQQLVTKSREIIKEAILQFGKPVMLWAGGKDSTTDLAISLELFKGKLPFPVMFIDTTYKFPETYAFIDKYSKKWKLNLIVVKNEKALAGGVNPWSVSHFRYCNELKTKPLKRAIREYGFDCVFVSIRWDEHGVRGKEKYFSPRKDPFHTRVHPMLDWSEKEIWDFIKSRHIPYNPLYDKEENGLVYRSIGCWPFTKPIPKDIPEERAGRQLDKERLMEDLRALGYM